MFSSKRKRSCALLVSFLAILAAGGSTQATISITPAYVDLEIQNGRASGRFKVANLGDTEERFRMSTTHFTFGEDGTLETIEPDEYSSADWIKFNPKEFTLPPKTQRVVRFALVPRPDVEPGEYWAAIELESLNVSQTMIDERMNVKTVSAILVPIFGRTGKTEIAGAITKTVSKNADGKLAFETVVENMGNRCLVLNGVYTLTNRAGEQVTSGPIGQAYLLRSSIRRFTVDLGEQVPPGDYTLHVKFDSPQLEQGLEKNFELTW